jgi:hypothetical protein
MIKLKLITVFICLTTFSSFAQIEAETPINKGSWLVGGNLNFSMGESDFKFDEFNANPMVGYFVGKKLVFGISQSFNYSRSNVTGKWLGSYTLQPFARYYFNQKKFTPFVEAAYGPEWWKGEFTFGSESYRTKGTTLSLRGAVGANYFISKNVALESIINYNPTSSYSDINFNVGLQFFIGRKK